MQTRSKALQLYAPPALPKPTSDEVAGVLGGLEHRWSVNALGVQQRFAEAIDRDDAASAQKWAIAAGISTEKVLLMKGRPTEIVANLHAHRHELSQVMDKLASAARVVSVHQRKGYASVAPSQVTRPLPSPLATKFVGSPEGHTQ
jgi:hypothetical protein